MTNNATISLSQSQRDALLSLQDTSALSDRTTLRLSTGRSVNSAVDDAVSFFRARSLTDRATDLGIRRSDIQQGISSLNTALEAGQSTDTLLRQLRGIAEGARSQNQTQRAQASTQFRTVLTQISNLVDDAQFQGLNLLNGTSNSLTVSFSSDTSSRLEVAGADFTSSIGTTFLFTVAGVFSSGGDAAAASGLFSSFGFVSNNAQGFTAAGAAQGFTVIGGNNSNAAAVDTVVSRIDSAISNVSTQVARLGNSAAILETRLDFTTRYINRLNEGSDNLVLADLNEEGANLLALQTRQQLGISALSLAASQQQAVLGLIR